MNHAGRSNAIGTDRARSPCSMIAALVSRFSCLACAPTVDIKTTRPGRAASIALLTASRILRVCGKPGSGS